MQLWWLAQTYPPGGIFCVPSTPLGGPWTCHPLTHCQALAHTLSSCCRSLDILSTFPPLVNSIFRDQLRGHLLWDPQPCCQPWLLLQKKNHKIKLIINKFMIPFLIRASVAFYSGFHYRALLNYILYIWYDLSSYEHMNSIILIANIVSSECPVLSQYCVSTLYIVTFNSLVGGSY